ncbi:MAG TPA: NAD(P)/FAD-dependent oxidoreductase [Egibacteraceae bacterium]|nr:NAD(P)/FAD-dependent oxidoreductase [Egibacteraceae bacterium]
MTRRPARILIAGAGYIGLYAALTLEQRLGAHETAITLVTPNNFMLYQPLLPEVASATIEPRHAVVPLRKVLHRTRLLAGRLTGLEHEIRRAEIKPADGDPRTVEYDHVVLGLGSLSRILPVPGLKENAVGFKSIEEALYLRNHVLGRMEAADATRDEDVRRRALTFIVVGGGYTGVEALAELEDMARAACDYFPTITPGDLRWVLVEATERILPTVDESLANYALELLRARDIEVYLETLLESVEAGVQRLSNGETIGADTLVWVAGVQPHPLLAELGFPTTEAGHVKADEYLRVRGVQGAWTGGDGAAVPDLVGGGTVPPTAQHAQREGTHIGENLVATLRGAPLEEFRHKSLGEMITLGRRKGVADIMGRHVRGTLPWALRRAYYLSSIPSTSSKLRIMADWLVGLPFRRDFVHLAPLAGPDEALTEAKSEDSA